MNKPTMDLCFQLSFSGTWLGLLKHFANEIDFSSDIQKTGLVFSRYIRDLEPALDGKPFTLSIPAEPGRHPGASIKVKSVTYPGLSYPFPAIRLQVPGHPTIDLGWLWREFKSYYQFWSTQELSRAETIELQRIEQDQAAQAMHQDYISQYQQAPALQSSHPYLIEKGLAKLAPVCPVKQFNDLDLRTKYTEQKKRKWISDWGEAIMIPLRTTRANYVGFQRIYDNRKMPESFSNKQLLAAHSQQSYKGAFYPLGEPVNGQPIAVSEGFATSGTIFLYGKETCVLFAMNSGNLLELVPQLIDLYPDSPIHVYADNDHRKKKAGNTGLKTAYELLAKYKGRVKCFIPQISHLRPEQAAKVTDYNDLLVHVSEEEARAQLSNKRLELSPPENAFHQALRALITMPRANGIEKQVRSCLSIGMRDVPAKTTLEQVVAQLANWLKKAELKTDLDLMAHANKILAAKTHQAMKARSINQASKGQAKSYKLFDTTTVDADVINYVKQLDGIVIFRSGMASRKTSMLIKSLMAGHGHYAYLAHRISLIGGAAAELNYTPTAKEKQAGYLDKAGVAHYKDDIAVMRQGGINKLACCINSITKPVFNEFFNTLDGLFIDEASQTLRHLMNGGVDNPKLVEAKLIDSINRCNGPVILCDADADTELFRYFHQQFKHKPIHIVELKTDCSYLSASYTDANRVWNMVMEDMAKQGDDRQRVLLATDNATYGEQLRQAVLQQYPDKKVLLITKDTRGEAEVKGFQDNPNRHLTAIGYRKKGDKYQDKLHNYDLLIYSPAISSGVSITVDHFTKTYGVFKGIVTPSDAVQMLRRNRLAEHFIIGFDGNHGSRLTDHEAILRGHLAVDARAQQDVIDWDRRLLLARNFTLFDETKCRLEALDNAQRNDFANNMLLQMGADGWKLTQLADDEQASDSGKAARKAQSEMLKEAEWLAIDAATTPDDCKARMLIEKDKSAGLTVDEKRELERYTLERGMQEPVTLDTYKEFKRGAIGQIRRFELLTLTEQHAREFDRAEKLADIPLSLRTQAVATQKFYLRAFEIAGINPLTGKGIARAENLRNLRDWLHQPHIIDEANRIRVGKVLSDATHNCCSTTLFKSLVRRFGLDLVKTRRRIDGQPEIVRQLDPQRLAVMQGRVARRIEAGITSFDPEKVGLAQDGVAGLAGSVIPPEQTDHTPHQERWETAITRVITELQRTRQWLAELPYQYIRSRFTVAERHLYEQGKLTRFDIGLKLHKLLQPNA